MTSDASISRPAVAVRVAVSAVAVLVVPVAGARSDHPRSAR